MDKILIRGARTHNLKNVDLTLPRDKLIVITGLSGSGKSSLAFDTLYAEGQRRYVESLSAYARQFLSMMEKPDVDTIEGLSPAISIEQKSTSHNPRSTVGTITEIYDYLRLLYARVGTPRCPDHDIPLEAQTVSQMVDQVLALPEGSKLMLLAPVIRERKGEHLAVFDEMRAQGFVRARVDGKLYELDEVPKLDKQKKHSIDVVVDRFKVRADLQQRLAESFETALSLADGIALVAPMDEDEDVEEIIFSARFACPVCGHSISELEPKLFSFNNPAGACPTCDGLGVKQFFDARRVVNGELTLAEGAIRGWDRRNVYYFQMLGSLAQHYGFSLEEPFDELGAEHQKVVLYGSGRENVDFRYLNDRGDIVKRSHPFEGILPNLERRYRETESATVREELAKFLSTQPCPDCHGTRLRREARHVWVGDRTLPAITAMPVGEACEYAAGLSLTGRRGEIAAKILKEIRDRLQFLVNVGLDYLTLDRSADTLSGGEAQRIRLASQIGAGLVGVMYILDEPSIGLHQRDNERLLGTLTHLRNLGNTVIVVEHDEDAIRLADYVVDIGPGAGVHGGQVVAEGTPDQVMNHPDSLTGKYLSGRKKIAVPAKRTPRDKKKLLKLKGARGNNLQNVNLEIPVGLFTCITGVSGSGKSTLIKTLAGDLPELGGRLLRGENLAIGYFAQHQLDSLDPQASPLLHLQRIAPGEREQTLKDFLGGFDFRGVRVDEPVLNFSGGEKARLALALIAWQKPNLLLLDEPTNHLDLEMRLALTMALQEFSGAVLVVSHDRHLLKSTTDEFLLVADGRVVPFDGDLDDYARWLVDYRARKAPQAETAPGAPTERTDKRAQRQAAAALRQQLAPHKREADKLERELGGLHEKLAAIEARLGDSALYDVSRKDELRELLSEQSSLKVREGELEERWLEALETLEALQKELEASE